MTRIVCLNAWGGRVHPALPEYLSAANADVICLQEVIFAPAAPGAWLSYRDDGADLPQRADMMADLQAVLPGDRATFSPAARGPLWHDMRQVQSYWGIATFTRDDLPVIAQAQGFVHGRFRTDGFGPHPRSRTAHALRLFRPAQDKTLTVAHMHGLRDPVAGKSDTPARAEQACRFADLVASVAAPDEPLVLCGDFNVLPDSRMFDTLRPLAPRELVTEGGHPGTRSPLYPKPGRFADDMLVNEAVDVVRFDVDRGAVVSDHLPRILDMT